MIIDKVPIHSQDQRACELMVTSSGKRVDHRSLLQLSSHTIRDGQGARGGKISKRNFFINYLTQVSLVKGKIRGPEAGIEFASCLGLRQNPAAEDPQSSMLPLHHSGHSYLRL